MAEKEIRYDVDGYEVVTTALMSLINQYPGLNGGSFEFSTLNAESGRALFPISGAIIEIEKADIMGDVRQVCRYPFNLVYRAGGLSDSRKAAVKELLDSLGRWLERQAVTVDGEPVKLEAYPPLTGARKILSIERQSPAYLDNTYEGNIEDWVIQLNARYSNEFKR